MIPVDLNRLRGAMTAEMGIPERRLVKVRAVEALLDASTVWWCAGDDMKADPMCRWATATAVKPGHSRCGWVALVPVKGEE